MSEHVLDWLPAYHDNELPPRRRQQVESHLQDCPSCQAELQTFMSLSAVLRADPLPQHTPPERFAAQVQLLLPHPPANSSGMGTAKDQRLPRWVLGAPLTLIVAGAFLQAALWVTVLTLNAAATFPNLAPWLAASSNSLDALTTLSALNIALLVGAVALWGSWMALWWVWQHNQHSEPVFNHLEKEV